MIKFPDLDIMGHFKSISIDLKSLKVIKARRWHLHIPIGILAYMATYIVITLIPGDLSFLAKNLITTFLVYIGCILFEWLQKGSRFIDEAERFENNKDAIVGVPPFVILILLLKITRIIK